MRAGVRAAEQRMRILPRALAKGPAALVVVGRVRPEHRPEFVGEDDVDEGVEVFRSSLRRDLANESPLEPDVRGRMRLADPEIREVRDA